MNDVSRFVDSIIGQRTPEPFRPDDDEAEAMRAAIELQAARTADTAPDAEFVARLESELAEQLGARSAKDKLATRRRVVQTAGIAAASLAAGVAIDRVVRDGSTTGQPRPAGTWQTVAASGDLKEGDVHEFELDTFAGYVTRTRDGLQAVSSTCTHLGCHLQFDAAARQLTCPCHPAVFALDGDVVRYDLPIELPPLPRAEVRERAGFIEIFVPLKRV
ncbi:ubiquinol-cytochrome c reductase iron-sulfur subunit [Amycolatopsis sp. NPDC059027]|uniref:QcrA and Rieske domain-containing protein n=1 Tax=unclassified Amycolatopsis TaxID=2618356 RepID=UPI0036708356